MENKPSFKLDVFEGPMDLLLHLISKHKLNINDIPIFELVEQYISYVRQMQEDDMEVASEFLEMAARLVYIKTVSLLPVHEEAEELKKELTGELLEYRDCQLMAGKLAGQVDGFDYMTRNPEEIEPDMTYTRSHDVSELFKAYTSAVGKGKRKLPPPIDVFKNLVAKKIIPVASKITYLLETLKLKRRQNIFSLYQSAKSKSELVATFLAVLELAKEKKINIIGNGVSVELELLGGEKNIGQE